jgi:hypothetical protein
MVGLEANGARCGRRGAQTRTGVGDALGGARQRRSIGLFGRVLDVCARAVADDEIDVKMTSICLRFHR